MREKIAMIWSVARIFFGIDIYPMRKILRDDDDFLLEAVSQVSRFRFLKLVLATMLLLVISFYPSCADVFFFSS